MEQICNTNLCTGCSACINVCPKVAIKMEEIGACGYIYPVIDRDRCIDCGLCAKTCPVNKPVTLNTPQKAFAAISKKKDDLMSSSSGAASSVMASHILANGGCVYGCVQESYCDISHRRIDTPNEAYKIKGSKYVQSNIGYTFKEVKKDLGEGKKVMFTGTPCQIAGLRNYLRKDYDNLYLIDLVCHGVPSQKLLRDDVDKIISENGLINKDIKVLFRKKSNKKIVYGLFPYVSKKEEIKLPNKYIAFLNNNYITAFMAGITFRENCFVCPYAQSKRNSDITIADFWGIKETAIPTSNGVSLLLANTTKGLALIEEISDRCQIEERTVEEAIAGNGQLMAPSICPKEREGFIQEYAIDREWAYSKHLKNYKKAYMRKQYRIKIYLLLTSWKPLHTVLRRIKRIIKR